MIIPLGERYQQTFYLFEKRDGLLVKTRLLPTLFVPMTGEAEDQRKKRPDGAHPKVVNGGFEISTDGKEADAWFYQRQATLEHTKAPEGKSYITFSNLEPGRDAHAFQGLGIDGARVRSVKISLAVKAEDVVPGSESYERPSLYIRFFDGENRKVGDGFLGPWQGSFPWRRVSGEIPVPRETHMAMMQIGLRAHGKDKHGRYSARPTCSVVLPAAIHSTNVAIAMRRHGKGIRSDLDPASSDLLYAPRPGEYRPCSLLAGRPVAMDPEWRRDPVMKILWTPSPTPSSRL